MLCFVLNAQIPAEDIYLVIVVLQPQHALHLNKTEKKKKDKSGLMPITLQPAV